MRTRLALGFATAVVSMCVNNAATAAMMLPVALGLVRALGAAGSRESPRGTLLVVGIAASVGGIATPVGAASNLIAPARERVAGQPISVLVHGDRRPTCPGADGRRSWWWLSFRSRGPAGQGWRRVAREERATRLTAGLTPAPSHSAWRRGGSSCEWRRWLPVGERGAGKHIGLHLTRCRRPLAAPVSPGLGGDRRPLWNAGRIDWGTLLPFGGSPRWGG
jgi:hypothetical protein